ncbi:MAG TPA: GAF domain-containing protein, partial [Aggregatilineales bacterium]|nr:GAF domain-containing protein [Aggregatilineales bacterium]
MRQKLLLPTFGLLLISLLILLMALSPILTTFALQGARTLFGYRLDGLQKGASNLLLTAQPTLLDLVDMPEIQALAQASTDPAIQSQVQDAFRNALIRQVDFTVTPFETIRVLGVDGQQLAVARYHRTLSLPVILPPTERTSEADNPYFKQLLQVPAGKAIVLPPHLSAQRSSDGSPELVIEIGVPVFASAKLVGFVIGGLFARDRLLELMRPSAYDTLRVALYDSNNTLIAATNPAAFSDVKVFLAGDPQLGQLGAPGDLPLKTGQTLQPFGDRLYSSAYIASVLGFHFVGWTVVISESTSTIFAESNAVYGTLSLVILGLLLVAGVVIFFLSRALTEPLVQVSQAAEQAARGEFRVDLHIDSQDEVGTLASALTVMSRRVSELIGTLEKRVAERTRNIEIVAEISRNAAQVRDIDRLLQTAVDDIRDRFNFYHAQIFLVDDIRQYAVLVTSTGEPGRILLARSHKLAIGSDSIVGQVVEKGRTFITLDTEKSEVQWRFNPVLPDTRSEMGLPLRLGDTVIGVLDIQSTKQEAFSQADVEVFEVLADQLAVAIDSARLLQETGRRVQQIDDLNRRLTRESWTEYAATRDDSELAYRYDLLNTSPGADGLAGTSVDIRVRGQSVGSLSVYENPALPLSEDDKVLLQSVAERVSLAVENVRLVEQTQIALAEIERLYTASRELGSTVNVEEVYAVAANYLKAFEALDRLSIMRASPDPVIWPQYLTYVYTWSRDAGDSNPVQTTGRIPRAALPFDRLLPDPFKPANIVLDEARLGPVLYSSMKSLGMQSLLAVPIATSTHWYGTLMCSSRRSTLFPPSFERFATAIADELSIIIDNRRLFEEAQTEARRNRALAEAVEVATRIGDEFETGVDSLFRAVVTQAGYDRWWFGLMETIAGVVVLRRVTSHFTENSPLYHMARISMAGETNPLAEAAFLGEPVLVNEPETHHVLANLPGDQKQAFGKHIALPIRIDENVVGAFLIGRAVSERDLDESDMQFANTLANQLVVAFNNRQLFSAAETGRRTLQTIIDSLPTGVAVMDAESHELVLTNEVARSLLGLEAGEGYQLVHTNSGTPYAPDDFPPLRVLNTGVPVHSEDMTVIRADGQRTDLIVNATTTHTVSGEIISAVAVFQDVTELRELEDVLQESLRETTTLYEANRALAAEHSVQDILGILVAQMKGICHPDLFCAVFRDESGELRNFYQADAESGMNVVQVEGALALPAAILVEQDVFIADSISEDPYLAGRPDLANLKVGAIATFPLNVRQQTIGWLILGFQGPRAFTPEERRLLTSLSDQAAIALEGSRLSEATNRALEETRQLYEATYRINRAPSVESVLQIVRDEVLRFGPSKIDMALVQADSATIQWVLDYDRADPASETIRLDTEAPLFEDRLLIDADAYFVGDIADAPADTLTTIQRLPGWERWAAHAAVPFTVKGRATGRLIIGFEERHEFARFERQFFSTIADQAAIVIDNASLIRQTQNSLEEIGTLYELSKEIMDSTDLSQILQVIIDHAAQPAINEAALIRLLAPSWTAPQATLEISASWDNELGMAVPSSQRLNREQYPLWDFVAQKEITWVADTDLESATRFNAVAREMLRGRNICSLVVVPLISGRRPIGALLIGASEAWPAGEREQRIYAALADQVAITMENRNLLQQAEQRARQLQISADVAHAASTILNLDELFDRTVNLIKDSFGYDHTQIFLVTEDNRDARLVASTGEAGRKLLSISHHLEVGSKSVIGQVTALGKPQIAANVSEIGVVWRPNPYLPNTRSEMALPLIARGRTLGALDVQSNEAGVFTLEDQEVLTNLANQIAVAIDNARLFETSTRRADEMRFLFDVTNV